MDYHQQSSNYNLLALRKKCLYSEIFGSVYSRIGTEYGCISPYSVQMRENKDQKNSKYEQFLLSAV